MEQHEKTGMPWIDFEPLDMKDEELNDLFWGRKKSGLDYVSGTNDDPKGQRVRVDLKIKPSNSKVGVPEHMRRGDFVKTTLILREGETCWEMLEDRIDPDYWEEVDKDVCKMSYPYLSYFTQSFSN